MGVSSGIGLLRFMSFLFAILSLVDSIVHLERGIRYLKNSDGEKSTNIYLVVLMIVRLLASIQYIIVVILSRRFGLKEIFRLLSPFIYALILALVMILSCFVIDFRYSTISLICHIIATYLALAVSFKLLVIKYLSEDEDQKITRRKSPFASVLKVFNDNVLALSTLVTVIIAVVIGIILRETNPGWNERSIKYVGFIGEIFLRMLKCLILPLIFSSLVFAMGNIDTKLSGKIGLRTVFYYMGTTVLAIILGIILVLSIRPGEGSSEESDEGKHELPTLTTADTILDLLRNIFPDNLMEACFSTYKTVLKPNETVNDTSDIDNWKITSDKGSGTNILGIVVFSIVFGIIIGQMKEDGKILVDFFRSFNNAMMTITEIVITLTPIAVLFLVLPQILDVEELSQLLGGVGWYTLTVLVGLFVHGLIVLPLLYFIFTRKNPFPFLVQLSAALMTAFGTASSSATMPVTFQCLEDRLKIDKRIVRFCIPVGATINMDGTALYEAVAAIFIAQYRNVPLDFVEVIIITITATAASIGAAGIPQAGLITMVIVLNAVGLPVEDAALIFVIDWLIDRFRTAINVLGDAFGAGIVSHLSKNDLERFNLDD